MKKILKRLFPKTIQEIEEEAVEEYSRFSDSDVLNNAVNGISFYIRGKDNADGQHKLYRFDPVDLGFHKTAILKPTS